MQERAKNWLYGSAALLGLIAAVVLLVWRIGSGEVSASTAKESTAPSNAQPPVQPLSGPWVVAIQPGHWEISDLPPELIRLRTNTGAEWGAVREVDVNSSVVEALKPMLEAKGWTVVIVPATVPPGLRADAFVAVHADSTTDTSRRGWKLSPPWRSSEASRELAKDLSLSFNSEKNLVEDTDGVTVNMRGYFAFNNRRFYHAISPYTPAVIIELGFLSNQTDRALLTGDPKYWAGIIARGLETYFKGRDRAKVSDLQPLELGWMAVGPGGAPVRIAPRGDAEKRWSLEAGTTVMPVDVSGDWYEVFMRRPFTTGWVLKSDLVAAQDPRWLMPGEQRPEGDRGEIRRQ
ncbi:MAG TPA: N-acetylmuramoyl-L-alanine amidase [Spirochaetia bacterium]|nr:N-acetylmuramoyl-L-alanine amidase [Spirochaetia bacterium]